MSGKSIRLTLIRCGQTIWHADAGADRVQGASDLPLSDVGRESLIADLHQLASIKPAVIHHPADEAATQTARLCAERIDCKTKAVEELSDPHLGLLEGLTMQEFEERFPSRFKQWEDDPLSLAPPEGEDMVDAADRLFNAVARVLNRTKGDEAAIVVHDLNLGLLRCWLADRPLNDLRDVIANRPRVEKYVIPFEMISSLETTGKRASAP